MMQTLANAIIAGSSYGLMGLAIGSQYRIEGYFNLAYGGIFSIAAYAALGLLAHGMWIPAAVGIAALVGGSVALLVREVIFQRLLRGRTPLARMVGSIGVLAILQNALALVFGEQPRTVAFRSLHVLRVAGMSLTPVQLGGAACAIVAGGSLFALTRFTSVGASLHAIADNTDVASGKGIRVNAIARCATVAGGAIAAAAGVTALFDSGIFPARGSWANIPALAAILVAPRTAFGGIVGAAFAIGAAQHIVGYFLPSEWQQTIIYVTLTAALLLRRGRSNELTR